MKTNAYSILTVGVGGFYSCPIAFLVFSKIYKNFKRPSFHFENQDIKTADNKDLTF